ncbi:MAG TPA: ComEC/Rec2 family competence protein, partial [Alphaproteobacteria bacterium]
MLGTGDRGAVSGVETSRHGARAAEWLAATLIAERDRWPLWAPVGIGTGIGIYFVLPEEPHLALLAVLLVLALAGLLAVRRAGRAAVMALLAPVLVVAGLALAVIRADLVAAPIIESRHGPAGVTGRVASVEPLESGVRAVIVPSDIERIEAAAMPRRVRLTARGDTAALVPGARVRVPAVLMPPPRPAAPGAYDYARSLYFQRIGAVGYAVGTAVAVAPAGGGGGADVEARLSALRLAVADRIEAAAGGGPNRARAEVAKALLTGIRTGIPDEVVSAWRDSGLAHLLAISGLHLGLVGGFLFFAVRLALASVEAVALRYPIKKWAAAFALVGAFAYLLLTGATVPTQRAFVMAALVLLAVILDREAVSMRPVALAALVVLALHPESMVGASFQMSFAAVIALVATFEAVRGRWTDHRNRRPGVLRRAALYVGFVAMTSVVAGAATAPFAAYHFGRLTTVGLVANLVAVPTTALWIMPWGLAGLLLMPVGLEQLALVPMAWGIELVNATARWCAGLPG